MINLKVRQQIAERLFPGLRWESSTVGFSPCPGSRFHTTRDTELKLWLDEIPSAHCFHSSCADQVRDAVRKLRSVIAKAERAGQPTVLPEAKVIFQDEKRLRLISIHQAAGEKLTEILSRPVAPKEWMNRSPLPLSHHESDDWKILLQLFDPHRHVWIGQLHESGHSKFKRNFRPPTEWLTFPSCPGPFTCQGYFSAGSFKRSADKMVARDFLVLESDELSKPETGAVFEYLRQRLNLVAVVDSGNKSIHGWFLKPPTTTWPDKEMIAELTGYKLDNSLFRLSQPVRLPGWKRAETGKFQRLLYCDPGAVQALRKRYPIAAIPVNEGGSNAT